MAEQIRDGNGNVYQWKIDEYGSGYVKLIDIDGNPLTSLNGALDIHDSDVHQTIISHFLYQDLADYTLASQANAGDYQITVTNSTGFVVGSYIHMTDSVNISHEHELLLVTAVNGNVLTLNRRLDYNFFVASTIVTRVTKDMNVLGSVVNPNIFKLEPAIGQTWHIMAIALTISDDGVMDDSKFGGINQLNNGIVLRKYNGTTYDTYLIARSNNSLYRKCFEITYSDKAPAGTYGLRAKLNFKNSFNSVIKLSSGERMELLIQDDLTGLTSFEVSLLGHVEGL